MGLLLWAMLCIICATCGINAVSNVWKREPAKYVKWEKKYFEGTLTWRRIFRQKIHGNYRSVTGRPGDQPKYLDIPILAYYDGAGKFQ